jgi:hypothetical protein
VAFVIVDVRSHIKFKPLLSKSDLTVPTATAQFSGVNNSVDMFDCNTQSTLCHALSEWMVVCLHHRQDRHPLVILKYILIVSSRDASMRKACTHTYGNWIHQHNFNEHWMTIMDP